MLLGILLTFHIIVCIALIGVVLIQRSEGGALGMGGGPSGFMTARGAGDLLTRTTWILGSIFFVLSLTLTLLAGRINGSGSVVDRMKIDAIDPSTLNQPPISAAQGAPDAAAPATSSAAPATEPLQAPAPQVRTPAAPPPSARRSASSSAAAPPTLNVPAPQVRNPLLEGGEEPAPSAPSS